jgi:hypothetical protein
MPLNEAFTFSQSPSRILNALRPFSTSMVIPEAAEVTTNTAVNFRSRNLRLIENSGSAKKFGIYSNIDPMWSALWYINRNSLDPRLPDMNILSAWKQGFSGKGVSVTFLDDGLEWVSANYGSLFTKDFRV